MKNSSHVDSSLPVIPAVTYFLAHVPNMIRHGSKPSREIEKDASLLEDVNAHLNDFDAAVGYPANQVYIGNLTPEALDEHPTPWYKHSLPDASRNGPFGEIMPEDEFIGVMKICDEFDILLLKNEFLHEIINKLKKHPLISNEDIAKLENKGVQIERIQNAVEQDNAMPLYIEKNILIGCCQRGHEEDFNLIPDILIENLTSRASGVMALRHMTSKFGDANDLDYLIGCGEEAVGDRYNRGGGNMAKAIGELSGCVNATGSDTKAFCCAPVHAIVIGAGLVSSGVFDNVNVVAGGSFAKLGMKFRGHLKNNMPILEDVIAGVAIWIKRSDGTSPIIRLDSVGKHNIQSGSSQQEIFQNLITNPLDKLGLKILDIDQFATEMHNPELTEPQGSGNVPKTNYRIVASLAVLRKEMERTEINHFIKSKGMPGFSPTQGSIASAIPVLGHSVKKMKEKKIDRTLFMAKGSLFLGRMTQLSDGISFLLERNSGGKSNGV